MSAWYEHQVLTMPGPQFLLFYAAVVAAVLLIGYVLRKGVRRAALCRRTCANIPMRSRTCPAASAVC